MRLLRLLNECMLYCSNGKCSSFAMASCLKALVGIACLCCIVSCIMSEGFGGRLGGRHQRRDRERSRSPQARDQAKTALAARLLLNWAWRRSSAKEVQELAQCAESDYGTNNTAIHALASIGSYGRNPQNCQRDLVRAFVKTPVQKYIHRLRECDDSETVCMIHPHMLFHMMHDDCEPEFVQRLGAQRDRLQRFWEGFAATAEGSDVMRHHPYLRGSCTT